MTDCNRTPKKKRGERDDKAAKQESVKPVPRPRYQFPDTPQARIALIALYRATEHLPPVERKEPRTLYYDTRWIVDNEEDAK